jgi:hypothetical protein
MFTSREKVIELLTELGQRLQEQGVEGEVYLVGGGAMLLGYSRTTVTKDLDAIYTPTEIIDQIADQMAAERPDFALMPGWLNSQVLPLLPRVQDARAWQALDLPGLTVSIASPEHLLAMKARAGRGIRDFNDVAVLADILEITAIDRVWEICETVWGFDVFASEDRQALAEYLRARGIQ